MPTKRQTPPLSLEFEELNLQEHPTSGTEDDDDDRDDEHAGENEAAIREIDETMETREEFEVDDEDELSHDDQDADADSEYDEDL